MEVVWKVCAIMVKLQLNRIATLYDALYGFRAGSGTGTATLEGKLAHQFSGIAHELLFQVFLYVRKAYNSLDRGWGMEIMRGSRMGHNTARLISHH